MSAAKEIGVFHSRKTDGTADPAASGTHSSVSRKFEAISPDENFYISESGALTLVFDKYEVAPGYMGALEFEIPTEEIRDVIKDGFVR